MSRRIKGSLLAVAAATAAATTSGCGSAKHIAQPIADPALQAPAASTPSGGPWVAVTSTSGFAYRVRAVGHPRAITHYQNSMFETVVAPPGKEFITFTGEIANAMTDRPVVTNSIEGSFNLAFPKADAAVFGAVPSGALGIEPGPGHCRSTLEKLPAGLCDLELYLLRIAPEADAIPVGGSERQTWVVGTPVPLSAPIGGLRLFFTTSTSTAIPWAS